MKPVPKTPKLKSQFSGRVLRNILNWEEQKRQGKLAEKTEFKKIYDHLKIWEPSKNASRKGFRILPTVLILRGELTISALTLYPVLCASADFKKNTWKHNSQVNLGRKAGLSVPTIERVLDELCGTFLEGEPLLERRKLSNGKKVYWEYKTKFIRKDSSNTDDKIFFHTYLIESGIWASLNRRSKALYLGLRCFGEYEFVEEFYENVENPKEYVVCYESISTICQTLQIDSSDIYKNLYQLEECGLICKLDKSKYKVNYLP